MTKPRILVLNNPHAMRINKELACEIGYNESVVLLQLDYLISISTAPIEEGKHWTYQSFAKLQKFFPWWSIKTISRTVAKLKEMELIEIGNFNRRSADRTNWYTMNRTGISKLQSISIKDVFSSDFLPETDILSPPVSDILTAVNGQDDTTLPKITPEITIHSDKKLAKPNNYLIANAIADVCVMSYELNSGRLLKESKLLISDKRISEKLIRSVYGKGGRWYKDDWRGQKGQPPKPHQIRETFLILMKMKPKGLQKIKGDVRDR